MPCEPAAPEAPWTPTVENAFHVVPSYMNDTNTFETSRIKSVAEASIVEPFLPTVKLFVLNEWPLSAKVTLSPDEGDTGKLIVKAPPDVSAAIASLFTAV